MIWNLWQDAVTLSGYDINGYPKIDQLRTVLELRGYQMKWWESSELLDKILLIQKLICKYKSENQKQ
jgi:hypothetical protein